MWHSKSLQLTCTSTPDALKRKLAKATKNGREEKKKIHWDASSHAFFPLNGWAKTCNCVGLIVPGAFCMDSVCHAHVTVYSVRSGACCESHKITVS
ncbi:hypothetical protein E2C01_016443 [Portunus trituberculatus]|uniref:Uncharacterized protein n=1 Tax=Portunus trituberculatus TaxID=210409 RepID=A0A5B7DQQ6_PORTR|nr:hypothetical protein [Portunus trituberculatus]